MEKGAFSMNGGDGTNSYARNSKYQEGGFNSAKVLLIRSILENLEIQHDSNVFTIADLGCSVGPNTFSCVQTIIEAVDLKTKTRALPELEFQVFFNDHVANDFNTLFKNLPIGRDYMVAAVPGSFHNRLFPKGSMSFMHSSFALHWLTKVPDEVTRKGSPAWNKGRITYAQSSSEVVKAFSDQFSKDIEAFFSARYIELAIGGLLAIVMPCHEEGTAPFESGFLKAFECLGGALADMVKEGIIRQELLDSFNFPVYFPTASEIKNVVDKNKLLTIERAEIFYQAPNDYKEVGLHTRALRAITEGILSKHFVTEIVDELFERCTEKIEELSKTALRAQVVKLPILFLIAKRSS